MYETLQRVALATTILICLPIQAQSVDAADLKVKDIGAGLANDDYSITELVQSYKARIEAYDEFYNVFTTMNPDALSEAKSLELDCQNTGPRSPLHGVLLPVKDSMNVASLPATGDYQGFVATSGGSTGICLNPKEDSPFVDKLRVAEEAILGMTNVPILALSGSNASSKSFSNSFDPSFNSYDRTVVPGGRSMSSAVGVSLICANLGMGEKTRGASQHPAVANGLVGIRTDFGLAPTSGGISLTSSTQDVFGPVAKSVYDAALSLDVMARIGPSEFKSFASFDNFPSAGHATSLSETSLVRERIGLQGSEWSNDILSPESHALYEASMAIIEAQCAEIVEGHIQ